MIKESVITFGKEQHLSGIISCKTETKSTSLLPSVILLSAGLLGRTGPFRLYTTLARTLADMGFCVLRFDLSGIGDSQKLSENRSHKEQDHNDIQQAMDALNQQLGSTTFVLIGLCTGADNAHKSSVRDNRVVGAVFIEGYAYPTFKSKWLYYKPRLLSLSCWINRIKNSVISIKKENDKWWFDERAVGYYWQLPDKKQTHAELQKLVERKVKLFYCFPQSSLKYLYAGQTADAFPNIHFSDLLHEKIFTGADHTFSYERCRKDLILSIQSWLKTSF